MVRRVGYLLALFHILAGPTLADGPADNALSERQRQALAKLREGKQPFAVMKSSTGRLVIILGERHVQEKEATNLGEKALREFPNVGIEGADLSRYWLGNAGWILHAHVRDEISKEGSLVPGTIDKAYAVIPANKLRNLEQGHSPDLLEQFEAGVPVTLVVGGASAVLLPFVGFLPCSRMLVYLGIPPERAQRIHRRITWGSMAAALGMLGLTYLGTIHVVHLSEEEAQDPTSTRGIVGNRNVTMSRNIAEWSRDLEGAHPLLTVVGSAHIPGLVHHLQNSHGFSLIESHLGT